MIFFIMGVSLSGKTTILHTSGVLTDPRFVYVPSYTTRPMRPGEINGQKYHHVSLHDFEQAILHHEFLEYALVHEMHFYGTKLKDLEEAYASGNHVIKEIEVQGLMRIKEDGRLNGKFMSIFLNIDPATMEQRMMARGSIDGEELHNRIKSAALEREIANEYCDVVLDARQPLEVIQGAFWEIVSAYL